MSATSPLTPASHVYFSQRLRLHYVDWTPAQTDAPAQAPTQKSAMVLVHGIHDHCRTWDDLVAHFAQDYRVLAPDLRGHGDSEWLRGSGYTYLDYVYDLHQLIAHTEVAPVTLVGHSLGGAVAALFAGVFPELVRKLVLLEGIGLWQAAQPSVPVYERVREWVMGTRKLAGRHPRKYPELGDALGRMQQANPNLSAAQAQHLTVHGSNRNEDGSYSWKYDNYTHNFLPSGFSDADTTEIWQRIACPVLILNADDGLEHRIGQDGSDQYFRDLQMHTITAAGHWTYHDQLAPVVAHMREFLR